MSVAQLFLFIVQTEHKAISISARHFPPLLRACSPRAGASDDVASLALVPPPVK